LEFKILIYSILGMKLDRFGWDADSGTARREGFGHYSAGTHNGIMANFKLIDDFGSGSYINTCAQIHLS
jgi:hypothetical protein